MLAEVGRHAFQDKCFEILSEIIPSLINARELGDVDRMGVDLYTLNLEDEQFETVFQCKGNEIPDFNRVHADDCLKSIRSFHKSDKKTKSYFLVVNRYIKDTQLRKELIKALQELINAGKANHAELLDLNGLVVFIFDRVKDILLDKIAYSNHRLMKDYCQRMEQYFYQEEVPFLLMKRAAIRKRNPFRYTMHSILSYTTTVQKTADGRIFEYGKNKWSFIISEFGFGKTSLLLSLAGEINSKGMWPIYLPIAQFDREAFRNEYNLCKNTLEIILEERFDEKKLLNKLLLKKFQLMLRSTGDYVLLFDGLDEHHFSYESNGLKNIFSCLQNFSTKCLFTVRKEFWDERSGTFEDAIGPKRMHMDFIMLTDWENQDIENYLRTYKKYGVHLKREGVQIDDFIKMVKSDSYDKYYGDIPKRPLFLKMLAEDIKTGAIKKRNLSQIYQSYLIDKFKFDRNTSVSDSVSERPLNISGDILYQVNLIFSILAEAARAMLFNDANLQVLFKSDIHESEVERIIRTMRIPVEEIVEILLNSVLVPFDRRTIGDFRVKFAHKSFQEYFTAFYFFNLLLKPAGTYQDYDLFYFNFSEGVVTFLKGMIEDIQSNNSKKEMCNSMVTHIYKEEAPATSLIAQII